MCAPHATPSARRSPRFADALSDGRTGSTAVLIVILAPNGTTSGLGFHRCPGSTLAPVFSAYAEEYLVDVKFVCDRRRSYSINSSATASRVGGTVITDACAVCILITNSNFVGCKTGMFAGRSPLRTRPT